MEWIKNPVPIGSPNWPSCPTVTKSVCEDKLCFYTKDDGSEVIMHICADVACPDSYPTPDNPLGNWNYGFHNVTIARTDPRYDPPYFTLPSNFKDYRK